MKFASLVSATTFFAFVLPHTAQAQTYKKKKEAPATISAFAESAPALHSETARSEFLSPGTFSIQAAFPEGGTPFGAAAVGGRYILSSDSAVSAWLLLGYNQDAKSNAFGVFGKYQKFLHTRGKALPYMFGGGALGKNGGDANQGEASDLQISMRGGAGVEVFLMPEISTFLEGGIEINLVPNMMIATGIAKIGLSYNFSME